ncbi:DUF5805 domain-containing protein [Halalkalicoccus sp. NIPERK01]|uniref:DUF5805 domain-containing protein n=1 Tax=Halalkalicoccus sp. NIPERK01 TaxID=3053469 RepID=UPI00256EE0D0|nr:DUF5805 domain-containing protein [Halalkalicoccus sp. NIPERK01]MDL5360766.1 DUF5805 domain-containing protein [Halalkalicoccus sp. NIPERK01]
MGDSETDRTRVTTYVPAYQAEIWAEHAKDLDMSRSEFVRTMVQAGRRGFDPGGEMGSDHAETADRQGFEPRVERALAESGPLSWDGLVEALTEDTEDRLDEALLALQEENRVSYSGRAGGYTLNGEHE